MSSIDDAKKHIEQMRYEMRNVLWQCFLFLAKKDKIIGTLLGSNIYFYLLVYYFSITIDYYS